MNWFPLYVKIEWLLDLLGIEAHASFFIGSHHFISMLSWIFVLITPVVLAVIINLDFFSTTKVLSDLSGSDYNSKMLILNKHPVVMFLLRFLLLCVFFGFFGLYGVTLLAVPFILATIFSTLKGIYVFLRVDVKSLEEEVRKEEEELRKSL